MTDTTNTAMPQRTKRFENKSMAGFFIKLFILASGWFVIYGLVLRPPRILDRPLTNFITASVARAINFTEGKQGFLTWREDLAHGDRDFLVNDGNDIFGIFDVCNGIDLMFIYVSILLLLPSSTKRKLVFIVAGIAAITLANIIRVYSLYYIYFYYRPAFDISHHYIFTILIYVLIFGGWLLFIRNKKINEKRN